MHPLIAGGASPDDPDLRDQRIRWRRKAKTSIGQLQHRPARREETARCTLCGTYSFNSKPALVKVCSVGRVQVTVDTTIQQSRTKTKTTHLDLSNGQCGRIEVGGQLDSTVNISPA